MGALLLFAQDEVGAIEGWFRLVDGRVVARGSGIGALPPAEDGDELFLLLSGSEVTMRWIELPALTEPQALAAARIAVADESLGPIETLHVAIGRIHAGRRLVAAIAHERIAAWIEWAAGQGLDPDHIVPLPLLIAYGEGPARMWTRPGHVLVHGALAAFTVDPELAGIVIGDMPTEAMDDARFEAELPAALLALPVDLRQGAWRRRLIWRPDAAWRGRVVRYAVAAAILLALIPIARLGRISWDSHRLHREAASVAQQTLGLAEPPDDPRAAMRQRLDRLQGPGMGFVDGAAVLFGAVRETPNVQLGDLAFDESGTLTADVAGSAADIAELVRRAGASGLEIETGAGAAQGTTSLRIRQP